MIYYEPQFGIRSSHFLSKKKKSLSQIGSISIELLIAHQRRSTKIEKHILSFVLKQGMRMPHLHEIITQWH